MQQLNLFDCTDPLEKPQKSSISWQLFVDGASRKNPGQSGAGLYLLKNGEPVYKEGFYLGIKTNNEAEYFALLLGIFFSKPLLYTHDVLYIVSDSELLVKQLKKEYRVKKPALQKLHAAVVALLAGVNFSFCHVLREQNTYADALANQGIDKGSQPPKDFVALMQSYEITI